MRGALRGAVVFSTLLTAALVGTHARAQQIPGVTLPGIPSPQSTFDGERNQGFGADPGAVQQGRAAPADAGGLLGLREPTARQVLTLDQVLAVAERDAADIRIAAERVVQQQANLRRAWATVLPTASLSGGYTLTCTGGGKDVVSCADRTTQLASPEQIDQQATLFESIANLLIIAAGATPNPQEQQTLLDDAAQLNEQARLTRERARSQEPIVVQPSSVFSGQLSLTVPLFNARSVPLIINAYDAVEVAGRARDQMKNALLYSATRAYHGAVAARRLVEIAERQLDSTVRHKEATRARVEAQTQPQLSLRRAELEELRARQQLHNARSSYDIAVASVGLLIGREEAFDVEDPGESSSTPPGDPEELAQAALAARPDVTAQRMALEIARRGELDAWMMFVPSLNLVANARASSFTQGFVRDPIIGSLSLTASVPLYDGGLRYAALKDSGSRIREESIRTRQLEDRVRAQVRGNARDIEVKAAALLLARETVAVAQTAYEQAEAMFQAGVGTSLDVTDTALALFLAENELTRAELDLKLARVGLLYVVGGTLSR
jgi:outer membrane protein TolC